MDSTVWEPGLFCRGGVRLRRTRLVRDAEVCLGSLSLSDGERRCTWILWLGFFAFLLFPDVVVVAATPCIALGLLAAGLF